MKIVVSNELQIFNAPDPLLRKIRDAFTIENPRWITQYLGRVLQPAPGKDKAKIYDYADSACPCPGGIGESQAAGISKHRRR